ncbi:MAG: 23S rRNA (uracil(1939)-C(5))-methyltransferase RlmD, partial [Candidatus Margulisiibacteriota bacterium]
LPNDYALGRSNNLVVFVPKAVYGDKVKVRIVKQTKNFAYGELVKIESFSAYRVEPGCPFFGKCGGCVFQNLEYKRQLEIKNRYLLTTLKNIGNVNLEKIKLKEIQGSPEIYFYRNKMEFAFGEGKDGIILGLRERNYPFYSDYRRKVVPLDRCEIFSPTVGRIFSVILDFAKGSGLSFYDPFSKEGFFRHLVVRQSKHKNETMVILVTKSGELKRVEGMVEKLVKEVPQVKSFYWVFNDQISDVVKCEQKKYSWGQENIGEIIDGLEFKVYPETFLQPNIFAAELLYRKALQYVKSQDRVLGLYCGMGPIEILAAKKAKEVVGIDSERINIYGARENCEI